MRKPQSPKYDFTCIHCGKIFHNCNRGPTYIPKYCSKKCNNEHIQHTAKCQYCGIEFTYQSRGINREPPKFCSMKCRIKNRDIFYKCLECGKEQRIPHSQPNRKFCSRKCSNNYNQKPDPANKTIFICKWCGKSFEEWTYRKTEYCSSQCRSEYGASIRAKQLYKGESINSKGLNWKKQARLARKRDHYTCQACGRHGWAEKIKISVHHIIPYRLFNGDYEKANSLDNLVSLCASCHPKVECGKIKLSLSASCDS